MALVATSMKKSRLSLDALFIQSLNGGFLFSIGGMLFLAAEVDYDNAHLLQGAVYPIALFYVVINGAELFNSNIIFFTIGVIRGAVGIVDLMISWSVSWLVNLGANLFVCYVISYASKTVRSAEYVAASRAIVMGKLDYGFGETLLRAVACNYLVGLAIFLQLMCKPLHVKFLMIFLPVFSFVFLGYNHTVADMYLLPMGLMNGADCSVGLYIWKVLIPETLGNIIGGMTFTIMVPWYAHIYIVEKDGRKLGLPSYSIKDEQPELGMDSRVVREVKNNSEDEDVVSDDIAVRPYETGYRSMRSMARSPSGVFPVAGMGSALEKEQSIASGVCKEDEDQDLPKSVMSKVNTFRSRDAKDEYLSLKLKRLVTRRPLGDQEKLPNVQQWAEQVGRTQTSGAASDASAPASSS